jgi:hypothetical protein
VCRHQVRAGWLEREGESTFLTDGAGGDDAMDALRVSSIIYRIAAGKHAGRKVATGAPWRVDSHQPGANRAGPMESTVAGPFRATPHWPSKPFSKMRSPTAWKTGALVLASWLLESAKCARTSRVPGLAKLSGHAYCTVNASTGWGVGSLHDSPVEAVTVTVPSIGARSGLATRTVAVTAAPISEGLGASDARVVRLAVA